LALSPIPEAGLAIKLAIKRILIVAIHRGFWYYTAYGGLGCIAKHLKWKMPDII
jgi:hypothetical protein